MLILEENCIETTIRINKSDLVVWKKWCKVKKMTSPELMEHIVKECSLKHQRELYLSLPSPLSLKRKLLINTKIKKKYNF